MEVRNVLQKLKSGKTLSASERKIMDAHLASEDAPKEVKTWTQVAEALGVATNTLRAWRTEEGSPKSKDLTEWKRFITERKAGVEGKGSGRIVVDGETYTEADIRRWKAKKLEGEAMKEEFAGKLRELEYRQKAENLIPESEAAEKIIKVLTPLRRLLDSMPRHCSAMANPQEPMIAELAMRNFLDDRVFSEIVKIVEQNENKEDT